MGGYSLIVALGFSFGGFSCRARALGALAAETVAQGLSSCGARTWLPCGMWALLGPGIKLASPALQGGFLTTGSPGKPPLRLSFLWLSSSVTQQTPHGPHGKVWGKGGKVIPVLDFQKVSVKLMLQA